jgi:hypothetical protein
LSSCSDFTSPDRFEGDAYSLSGLLIAGRFIDLQRPIYLCRSSSINDFNYLELYVLDAQITLYEINGVDTTNVFTLTPQLDQDLESPNPMPKIKYIDPLENVIKADHTYRIEALIPGYERIVWAETHVPKQATLVPDYFGHNDPVYGFSLDPNTDKKMLMDQVDTMFPLALEMGDYVGPQYFLAEFFCMEEFSTDLEFTTPVFGFTNPDETMRDSYYQSGESIRRIQFMGKYVSQFQDDTQGNYLMVRDYKQAFVFYGKYKASAYVVDNNYYRYSFMPEGYLYGGVHNGLGYFGSASGGVMYTTVSKQ